MNSSCSVYLSFLGLCISIEFQNMASSVKQRRLFCNNTKIIEYTIDRVFGLSIFFPYIFLGKNLKLLTGHLNIKYNIYTLK
jgi:hypothetical protein